jgi:HAD superfamily hydrolase (TIGR01549 family)
MTGREPEARALTAGRGLIEAVIFDLDGTLADSMALVPQAYADTIRDLGGPEVSTGEVVATWNMGSTPVVLGHFLRREVTSRDIDRFYAHFKSVMAAVRPFPGIAAMLGALRGDGYRLGVFTHATRRAATAALTGAGLGGFRLTLVGGDEITEPKPAPEGLLLACQRIHVTPAAVAYVGDAETDLQCALAAGALGVHARWGASSTAATPHLIATRPGDVAGLIASHR